MKFLYNEETEILSDNRDKIKKKKQVKLMHEKF